MNILKNRKILFSIYMVFVFAIFLLFNITEVKADIADYCDSTTPCGSNEICFENICYGGERHICSEDYECNGELQCIERFCSLACDDGECGEGRVCLDGACIERSAVSECENDAACGSGRYCVVHACTDGNLGDACEDQGDCEEGRCWGDLCRRECEGADDTTTCGDGYTCNLDGICTENECDEDNDCPDNHTCNSDHRCMSDDRIVGGGGDGLDDGWRADRLREARNSERGVFTEGLSAECIAFGRCSRCDMLLIGSNVFRFAFQIVGILAVLIIFMGGLTYIRSGGSEETVGKAKKIITGAVIGLLVVFCAWMIINTIVNMTELNVGGSWFSPNCS